MHSSVETSDSVVPYVEERLRAARTLEPDRLPRAQGWMFATALTALLWAVLALGGTLLYRALVG